MYQCFNNAKGFEVIATTKILIETWISERSKNIAAV